MAVAMIGPMPGTLARRWLTGLLLCQAMSRLPRSSGSGHNAVQQISTGLSSIFAFKSDYLVRHELYVRPL